jgi:hypothetical protein
MSANVGLTIYHQAKWAIEMTRAGKVLLGQDNPDTRPEVTEEGFINTDNGLMYPIAGKRNHKFIIVLDPVMDLYTVYIWKAHQVGSKKFNEGKACAEARGIGEVVAQFDNVYWDMLSDLLQSEHRKLLGYS